MSHAPGEWDPADYAKHSSAQAGWGEELIGRLGLRGNESVLDVGCGDGTLSARLADLVPRGRVLGIDLSPEMVAAASRDFPPETYPNLEFVRMDALRIGLPRDFDVAFSNAVLHWVEDHRAVLAGVARCLLPGGRILFQMGGRGNADDVLAAATTVMAEPPWAALFAGFVVPYHFYSPEDYGDWLVQTGFRTVQLRLVPKDMRHESVSGLIGWMRTTWFPFTDVLPPEWRDDFLERTAAAYLAEHPPDADGATHVAMVRLEVEARLD